MKQSIFRLPALLSVLAGVLLLGACATVPTPQQAVSQLDSSAPKYQTQECMQARQIAMSYDGHTAGRAGIGIGLGLLLGPFGLPLAYLVDRDQNQQRDAVLAELKKHCEGDLVTPSATTKASAGSSAVAVAPAATAASASAAAASNAPSGARGESDSEVRLRLLQDLKDKGLISQSEFDAKRKALVDQL